MKSSKFIWLVVLAGSLGCGSNGGSSETAVTSTKTQALSGAPGSVPVPCAVDPNTGTYKSVWDGNNVELIVADVDQSCQTIGMSVGSPFDPYAYNPPLSSSTYPIGDPTPADSYIQAIRKLVNGADSALNNNWRNIRNSLSCDLSSQRRTPYQFEYTGRVALYNYWKEVVDPKNTSTLVNKGMPSKYAAQPLTELAYASCVAQGINKQLGSGAGLLLPQEQQLELANVARTHAQRVVQLFTAIAAVAADDPINPGEVAPPNGLPDLPKTKGLVQGLRWFMRFTDTRTPTLTQNQAEVIASLQQDFAGALEILVESSKEMGSLMARSRSAKESVPGGSSASVYGWKTPGDQLWGAGSWTQREIALQLGGEPFGIIPNGTPLAPGSSTKNWFGTQWPAWMLPYISTDASAPQIATVTKLIRQFRVATPAPAPAGTLSTPIKFVTGANTTCRQIDVDATAALWSTTITAGLNANACLTGAAFCAGRPADPNILKKQFQITSQDVQATAQILSEMLGGQLSVPAAGAPSMAALNGCAVTDSPWPMRIAVPARPVQALRGALVADAASNTAYLANWDFSPRGLEEIAGGVSGDLNTGVYYLRYPIPFGVQVVTTPATADQSTGAEAYLNGFTPVTPPSTPSSYPDYRDSLGILPTLVATRAVLAEIGDNGTGAQILPVCDQMIKMIDAAVGSSVYMVPDSGGVNEIVRITGTSADPFWSVPDTTKPIYLIRLPETSWTADLVRNPESKVNGININQLIKDTMATANKMSGAFYYDSVLNKWEIPEWKGTFAADSSANYTLIAVRFPGNYSTQAALSSAVMALSPDVMRSSIRLLGSGMHSFGNDTYHGTYLALGGALGTTLKREITPMATNPALPAYDGFGLANDWVPPFSSEVLGGDPSTSSASYYMTAAKTAGQDASQAVQRALQDILDEQELQFQVDQAQHERDESSRKAKIKAEQGLLEEKVGLCGQAARSSTAVAAPSTPNTDCGTAIVTTNLGNSFTIAKAPNIGAIYPSLTNEITCGGYAISGDFAADPAGTALSTVLSSDPMFGTTIDPAQQLNAAKKDAELAINTARCLVRKTKDAFLGTQVQLADKVAAKLVDSSQPAFVEFSGGSLQPAFIEQWAAIKTPDELFQKLLAALDAAQAQVEAANAVLVLQGQEVRVQCSAVAMARAVAAGFSAGIFSATWSAGPLLAQQDRCDAATRSFGPEIKKAAATNKEAYAGIVDRISGIGDAATRIAKSGAAIAGLTTQASLAARRVDVESQLDIVNPLTPTSLGTFRQFRAYDIWRARALLENARRYAVAARRAVEARYTVNLSKLTDDEPFVKSPTTWAEDVYKYDLSVPSAVGLVTGSAQPNAIYANGVEDYVNNLQAFVNGYAVERPTATAKGDVEVLLLPGISDGTVDTRVVNGTTYYTAESRGVWMMHCPAGATLNNNAWTYMSGKDAARLLCDSTGAIGPDMARYYFSLDPWGRVNGNLSSPPYDNRYNVRWNRLAINLVGTAIRDCSTSADPQACYNQGFIRYDLRHQGIAWITDFAGQWRSMNLPPGVVEGGKALAIEAWLDPLKNGWETSYISSIARTEYAMRPIGGDYMIELQGGPDVHLERIERVQVMAGTDYWVSQK